MSRTHYLNPALYNKLYAAMQYENALALRVSLETGFRIDDVLHLQVSDLRGRTLFLSAAQKTGKPDKKVISADLAKRLKQVARNGRFFDGRFGNKPRTRQAVWRDVKKAAKIIGLSGNIAPHSARKTYAVTDFRENGLAQTQRDLQHDRTSTTLLYAFADLLTASESKGAAACERSQSADLSDGTAQANTLGGTVLPGAAPTRGTEGLTAMQFAELVAGKVLERIEPLILGLTDNA